MLALLAVAFVSGLSIGVIGDRVASRLTPVTSRPTDEISSVLDELSLTKDQRDKAETILERRAPRAEGVMVDAAAHLQAISDSVDHELRSILSPTQQSKLGTLRHRPIFLLKR